MTVVKVIWYLLQFVIGINLLVPAFLYLIWLMRRRRNHSAATDISPDYAIIVTAYQFTNTLPSVIASIGRLSYENYLVYIVADNCDAEDLNFESNNKVIILKPSVVLGSNTKSHQYALDNFVRDHDYLTIIDSDNIIDPQYLNQLNITFGLGYKAVQGLRAAKNLDGTIASLDAARDIYYHFYDGKLLYESGSSATLSGSGMAFEVGLYKRFLNGNDVKGAGFDKVLQAWILKMNLRIAFNEQAIVYDEKTSKSDQLVKQRSRWINTWFKYFSLGFNILFLGIGNLSKNQILFGIILLRPPLFIFLFLSVLLGLVNLFMGDQTSALLWVLSMATFILFFFIALLSSHTDKRIYKSLINIPQFVFLQILSLVKSKNANKISVATRHFHVDEKAPESRGK